jgi:hypothetical protein
MFAIQSGRLLSVYQPQLSIYEYLRNDMVVKSRAYLHTIYRVDQQLFKSKEI